MKVATKRHCRTALVALACGMLLAGSALHAGPPGTTAPTIGFANRNVRVEHVTPGGNVVVFAIANIPLDYWVRQQNYEHLLSDTDQDGAVDFALDDDLPGYSIWVAVDVASGGYVVGAPPRMQVKWIDFPGAAMPNGVGQVKKLAFNRATVELVLVRPGAGAWSARAHDGGKGDDDLKNNGKLEATMENFRGIGTTAPPPDHYQNGDVIVAIDSDTMEVFATSIGR